MNFLSRLSSAKKNLKSIIYDTFGWRNDDDPILFEFPEKYDLYAEFKKTNMINEYMFEDCELFLDAYYIVSDLGKGSFGSVKLA